MQSVESHGFKIPIVGLGTWVIARVLRSIAPELSPQGPAVALTVTLVLVASALLASWLPARRATHVNPVDALRAE